MYVTLKILHLGSLIMWLGPAIGSWLVLRYVQHQEGELSAVTQKVYRVFFWTITLEHIALCSLLLSGATMAFHYGFIATPWLQQKLWLVLLIIVPLEVVDIWLGNWKVKRLVEKRSGGAELTPFEQGLINFYHKSFTNLALVVLPITVLLIMWMAVSKLPLWP